MKLWNQYQLEFQKSLKFFSRIWLRKSWLENHRSYAIANHGSTLVCASSSDDQINDTRLSHMPIIDEVSKENLTCSWILHKSSCFTLVIAWLRYNIYWVVVGSKHTWLDIPCSNAIMIWLAFDNLMICTRSQHVSYLPAPLSTGLLHMWWCLLALARDGVT